MAPLNIELGVNRLFSAPSPRMTPRSTPETRRNELATGVGHRKERDE